MDEKVKEIIDRWVQKEAESLMKNVVGNYVGYKSWWDLTPDGIRVHMILLKPTDIFKEE